MYREIVPSKIIAARRGRPRKAIAESVGNRVTEMDIYSYEKGLHRPSKDKLAQLLKGLNVTFDDISEPVELTLT